MALIKASVLSGAYLAGASEADVDRLNEYAYNLGLAFQIRDDFEDEIEDGEQANDCPNFINILGREVACNKLKIHHTKAYDIVCSYDSECFLSEFHRYLFK